MGQAFLPHSQEHLLLQLATPLDKDLLIPVSVHGEEAMSQGFTYKLRCFSEDPAKVEAQKKNKLIGNQVTFSLGQEDPSHDAKGTRYFNGYVKSLRPLGMSTHKDDRKRMNYEMTIVSWLWFLEQTSGCRVFQNMTIPQVIEEVCKEWSGYGGTKIVKSGNHPEERFLVQFNETNYNFIARLARRAGMFWYITHDQKERGGKHTVNFCDAPMRVPQLNPKELVVRTGTASHDHISRWTRRSNLASGQLTEAAYDYNERKAISAKQDAAKSLQEIPRAENLRRYHFTEEYQTQGDGDNHAKRAISRQSQRHELVHGTSGYRMLKPGHHFKVTTEPRGEDFPDQDQSFTLTRVSLQASNEAGGGSYATGFEAVPRGEAVYPWGERPTIANLQTAVVTGHAQDTVYTDHDGKQLGRVKVKFHWDREHEKVEDPNSSCWLRVMQNGAGNGFSSFYALPRVGSEVVVAFENGNPDRPFVLGALPHPSNKPPYGDDPHRSGIKTQSFNANGPSAGKWNELRFNDKDGSEEVYLRAEKDYNGLIQNNRKEEVGKNATEKVGEDLTVTVNGSETRDLGKALTVTAGSSITLKVGGNSIKIDSSGITITGGAVTVNGNPTSIN